MEQAISLKTTLLSRVVCFCVVSCILVSRSEMPRKGWSTMQVPDGFGRFKKWGPINNVNDNQLTQTLHCDG